LFSEPVVNKKENGGENQQCNKSAGMRTNALMDIPQHFIHADEVGHEVVGNNKGDEIKHYNLGYALSDFESIPRHCFQLLLFIGVSIHPVFNFAEYHLHENGLGTGPATKNATKNGCKKNDEHYKGDHGQCKDEEVLRTKNLSENDKLPLQHIDHDEGLTIHFNPWQSEKDSEIDN
jgi:hypothetical protein